MNSCNFLGRLYGDVYHTKDQDIDVVSFQLEVENFRKNKNGTKSRTVAILEFEAWHTAALTISQKLNVGDLILVECSAKTSNDSDKPYFRVNSFKIFNKERYSEIKE